MLLYGRPILLGRLSFKASCAVKVCGPFCSMQAIQNLGLAVIAIVAGAIVDSSGYLILEVFFLACLCGMCFRSFLHSDFFVHL